MFVDYELSSWKYQGQLEAAPLSPFAKYIAGCLPLPENCGIVIKQGTIIHDRAEKGSGSAYGGEWIPKKPEDERFIGEPGEIKETFSNGYRIQTRIGANGKADFEYQFTDHHRPDKHTNPHGHTISWICPPGYPNLSGPINYPADLFPEGPPELKLFEGEIGLRYTLVRSNSEEDNRFDTIYDFQQCINRGGEVEFEWKNVLYGVVRFGTDNMITIYEANRPETEMVCQTVDDALEYMVGGDRLRDVITRVRVLFRSV